MPYEELPESEIDDGAASQAWQSLGKQTGLASKRMFPSADEAARLRLELALLQAEQGSYVSTFRCKSGTIQLIGLARNGGGMESGVYVEHMVFAATGK